MNETLKALYDSFYQPLELAEEKQEVKDCHWQLIERLDKPERKLVLRIIDAKDRSAELLSIDSFICGFELACKLAAELEYYKKIERPESKKLGPGAHSACQGEDE